MWRVCKDIREFLVQSSQTRSELTNYRCHSGWWSDSHPAHTCGWAPLNMCPWSRLRIRISLIVSQQVLGSGQAVLSCPGIPLSDSSVVPHLQIKQPCILEMATSTEVAGKRLVALVLFVMFAMQMFCLHMSRARGGELRPGLKRTPTRTVMGRNNHQNTTQQ